MLCMTMLAIAGATLFAGCSKDNDDKGPEQHDTVYCFGPGDYDAIDDLEQIQASADSVEVRNVIFKVTYDKRDSWGTIDMKSFYNNTLEYAFIVSHGKGVGNGVFKGVGDNEWNRSIESTYTKLGFDSFQYRPKVESQNQR